MNKNELPKKKLGRIFIIIGIILFPLLSSLYIVSVNSNRLINGTLSLIILILACYSFVTLITGIFFYKTGTDKINKRLKKSFRIVLSTIAIIYVVGGYSIVTILYFPGSKFKDWLITTAMTTMNHQYFATWFYDDYDVNKVLANNVVIETGEETNPDLIVFTEPDFNI